MTNGQCPSGCGWMAVVGWDAKDNRIVVWRSPAEQRKAVATQIEELERQRGVLIATQQLELFPDDDNTNEGDANADS